MELNIGIIDSDQANEFLRSLWAEIATEFGSCGWSYMPYKDIQGKRIHFGVMAAGQHALAVSISYKDRGSIINLYFDYPDTKKSLELDSPLGQQLKRVVRKARRNMGNYQKYLVTEQIKSYFPLSFYETKFFKSGLLSEEVTEISFPVWAYDNNQCNGLAVQKLNQIMDFLAVETNVPFWKNPEKMKIHAKSTAVLKTEQYQDDDFISEYSLQNDCLVISKKGKAFLDFMINNNDINEDLNKFLNACYHFHTARKYDAQIFDYKGYKHTLSEDESRLEVDIYTKNKDLETAFRLGNSHTEIASTLYMSALEVVTLIGFKEDKCDSCGQTKFSIMRRVKELASKYLNPVAADSLSDYYNKRSEYLHKGSILTNPTPSFSSVPLLDKDDNTGTNFPVKVMVDHLREDTSYILRNFYKEHFANILS
ncbi:hypothetical protein ACFPU1_16660 [Thalassorhabdus alkalitolerans]|uniref:Apea-like HEPN domain-containing protein n=1 Tax=Thalassorhabdus alkalitolerans TaxID=2282697 RepID=A0ABW0YWG6_9BACI